MTSPASAAVTTDIDVGVYRQVELFVEFMSENGCAPDGGVDVIPDDVPRYYTIAGDKRSQKRGSYCLMVDGDFAYGWVHDHRVGETYNYVGKRKRGVRLTAEQKKEREAALVASRQRRDAELIKKHTEAAKEAKAIWDAGKPVVSRQDHPYLVKKGIDGAGCRVSDGLLLIPGYADGALWMVQSIDSEGDKLFQFVARKKGCYAPIAKAGDNKDVIVIAEGYATAESVRMATGYVCVAAFDCGNLELVAVAMREKYPEARIIIAADNDQWRFDRKKKPKDVVADEVAGDDPRWAAWREAGVLENIGVIKAREVAAKIRAHVVTPDFAPDDSMKNKDWNDAATVRGLDYVGGVFKGLVSAAANYSDADMADGVGAVSPDGVLADSISDDPPTPIDFDGDGDGDGFSYDPAAMPFVILGYDAGKYYFMPKSSGQIVDLSPGSLAFMANLFQLAPLDYWLDKFGGGEDDSHRKIAEYAANALMALCHERGVFRSDRVRGIGVWNDNGRRVFHCGDALYVDGVRMDVHDIESRYIYPKRDITVPELVSPLSNADAAKLRDICRKFSWEYKVAGDLLAGWVVVAMVCAALKWRPHIWVTGESESGKTTVVEGVILKILEYIAIKVEGGTSEAAIRQMLMCDGRPVIYEEAEGETQADRTIMQGIMQLVRRSSSGGTIVKGSTSHKAVKFTVRSCFVFSAINTGDMQRADESRISKLVIKRASFEGADKFFTDLKLEIAQTITPEYGHRLMSRTIQNLPVLLKNCDTFVEAAALVLKSRRAADQIAPMLAGAYLLTSTKEIRLEDAVEWMKQYDFAPFTAVEEKSDPERIIMHIVTRDVRYTTDSGSNQTRTISELLERFYNKDGSADAERVLRVYGVWPMNDGVLVSNSSPRLKELMKDTPWANWARPLGDIKGAERVTSREFVKGMRSRAVKLPLSVFGFDGVVLKNAAPVAEDEGEEIIF